VIARFSVVVSYIFASLLLFAPAAGAQDGTPPGGVVTVPDLWLTFLVASVLPILVGILKARFANSRVGALLLLFLSVISGWLTSLSATGGSFEPKTAAVSILMTFVTATGMHYGFLKPAGVTGDNGIVEKVVPKGIGKTAD
jgi:hypothetical protein